jgi:hypothetical protein
MGYLVTLFVKVKPSHYRPIGLLGPWGQKRMLSFEGGIVLEEAVDLSSDRLLINEGLPDFEAARIFKQSANEHLVAQLRLQCIRRKIM